MKSRAQRRSRTQERRVAADVGGKVQAGSGNAWSAKGDVRKMGQLRVEAKYTERPRYILKLKDVLKIRSEALQALETWVMQLEHVHGPYSKKYAICDFGLFQEMHYDYQKQLHALEQREPVIQDFWTPHLTFTLDLQALNYFLAEALTMKGVGVYRIAFSQYRSSPVQTLAAIFQWDHFLTINEALKS